MRRKPLVWNACLYSNGSFKIFNIFDHPGFAESVKKDYKKYKTDREEFEKRLKSELRYYFWSKCEYEIILSPWPPHGDDKDKKIDVFDQIEMNWDRFREYVWTYYAGPASDKLRKPKNVSEDIEKK